MNVKPSLLYRFPFDHFLSAYETIDFGEYFLSKYFKSFPAAPGI